MALDSPHLSETANVLAALNSGKDGLSDAQVNELRQRVGPNQLQEKGAKGFGQFLLEQFFDFMIVVLLLAAVVAGMLSELVDTIAILVIVFFNAIIGAVQSYRADRAIASLKKLSSPKTLVKRAGHWTTVDATSLVPGDIVRIEAGNLVAADMRLLDAEQLHLDESTLTGESVPVSKDTTTLTSADLPLSERFNMVFTGSVVTKGIATGVVVNTGMQTELGKIASLLSGEDDEPTPLQLRLSSFGRYLAGAILVICALVFVGGLMQGQPMLLMLLTSVSLAVAAIPEALPAVIAVSLALGARKLLKLNALVRNLPAVETLGSVTYICTDKTGTLTQNQMMADVFVVDEQETRSAETLSEDLIHAMLLNNDVTEQGDAAIGEPTELGLFHAARQLGYQKSDIELTLPRTGVVPFSSERKRMSTIHSHEQGAVLYCKGAAEVVLARCSSQQVGGAISDLNIQSYLDITDQLAARGYRVLALAKRTFSVAPANGNDDELEQDLVLLGLVGLIDPLRPEVPQAMADCAQAGIHPIMITGDHPRTAVAIANNMGWQVSEQAVVDGKTLAKLSPDAFEDCVSKTQIYARVAPEQKLHIVSTLQQQGEFVAMTGDGVNDAPALKKADIGVAMGQKGTDVARQASDMVLLDDNFATIVKAVKAGRRVFDNIRKFIKDTLSSNSGEIWTLFLAPFFGLPIPLLPIHILWINLVTDGLPGLAFSAEPAEPKVMSRPPRPPNENIFAHGMWQHIVWVGLFVAGLSLGAMAWAMSTGREYWQTVVFTVLTLAQLFHSFVIRSERESLLKVGLLTNKPMVLALVLAFAAQLSIIYLPMFNDLFNTQPLPLADLLLCIGISSLVLWVVEIEKWLTRRGLVFSKPIKT